MSCFPFFMEIGGRPALIAGGGRTALRKIEKLLPYGPRLTVAAPDISADIAALPGLRLLRRPFCPEDLEGMAFAVAATGERRVNRRIAALCRAQNIPVNVVDDPAACTFLFPALVKRGELSIGISSGGASPSAAVFIRDRVEELLPDHIEDILDFLKAVRPGVKAALPEEEARARAFAALFRRCLEEGRPLTVPETEDCLGFALPAGEGASAWK